MTQEPPYDGAGFSRRARSLQTILAVCVFLGLCAFYDAYTDLKEIASFHLVKGEKIEKTVVFPYNTLWVALETDNGVPCSVVDLIMSDGHAGTMYDPGDNDHTVGTALSSSYNPDARRLSYKAVHLKCIAKDEATLKVKIDKPYK
jgi:hypothetical protein